MKILYALDDLRRRPRTWVLAATVAAVACAVTWTAGGFAAVPAAALSRTRPATSITTNQWTIRPLRAWAGDSSPAGRKRSDGSRVLVIELDMTNRTPKTSNLAANALRIELPGVSGQLHGEPKIMELLRDPSIGADLHPRMTERVAAVWELAPAATAPTRVELTVVNWTFKLRDSLMGASGWFNPTPLTVVSMPVENRIAPEPAPPAPGSLSDPAPPPAASPGREVRR